MNVLLVDDEPLITEGIEKLLKKTTGNTKNFTTFKTTSGIEALKILNEVAIDILLTDIRMPDTDGLALAKKARCVQKQIKIIFISSYDDFSYLKQAILIGSSDYLLKPVDPIELATTFGKLTREIKEEKLFQHLKNNQQIDVFRVNLLRKLLHQEISSTELAKWQDILEPITDWQNYTITYLEGAFYNDKLFERVSEQLSVLFVQPYSLLLEPNKLLLFFSPKEEQHYRLSIQYLCETFDLFAVIGSGCHSLIEITHSYRSIEPFMESKNILENPLVIDLFPKTTLINEYQLTQKIYFKSLAYLENQSIEAFQQLAIANIDQWKDHPIQSLVCHYLLIALHKGIATLEKQEQAYQELQPLIYALKTADKSVFKKKIGTICSKLTEISCTTKSHSPVIDQILYLVNQDFTKRYSLKSLAERFHMNPAYLGQLFLKELNMSFSEYDKKIRMREANQRIKESTERITVIAKALGYDDISLFYRHYKKEYGITPNKARKFENEREPLNLK
ncbi:response regulator transcription factor [Enterococcus sp. DIV1421a]|uniref:response regulator transcription factor n=1 Tax=Enterococcus sp. DIV1421a TaxID=2774813 RepID=UPI003F1F0FD8